MSPTTIFAFLPNLEKIHIFFKKSQIFLKKQFKEILPFNTHSTASLPPFPDREKNRVFLKKTYFYTFLRVVTISIAFCGKLALT